MLARHNCFARPISPGITFAASQCAKRWPECRHSWADPLSGVTRLVLCYRPLASRSACRAIRRAVRSRNARSSSVHAR